MVLYCLAGAASVCTNLQQNGARSRASIAVAKRRKPRHRQDLWPEEKTPQAVRAYGVCVYGKQVSNAPHRTRTCNLRFRRPMLYPIELGVPKFRQPNYVIPNAASSRHQIAASQGRTAVASVKTRNTATTEHASPGRPATCSHRARCTPYDPNTRSTFAPSSELLRLLSPMRPGIPTVAQLIRATKTQQR
jgi:hypothetical protein